MRLTALSSVPRTPGSRGSAGVFTLHSGFSPDAPVFTVWEHPEGKQFPEVLQHEMVWKAALDLKAKGVGLCIISQVFTFLHTFVLA